ncbi:hypothetical protein B0J11DRAFT_522905 [Dendryphion nanum]|uniref:Uncharacterized protein n=1 Tax=Dendryphion nanum TaxID=256645 RepID=A0A9P9E5H2_9PLEO|nr:hypothetical protein B0J11DRAFT_522905 [Dendryphion nanum]
MAKEDEKKPTAAEKGKAKATNGEAEKQEAGKGKDGKPEKEDKKGVLPPEELSEEDQQLKNDLEMLVDRILVRCRKVSDACLVCLQLR